MPDAKKIIAATAGVAAATGLAVAAGKKLRANRRATTPDVIYHVKLDGDVWTIEAEGDGKASSRHQTKRTALSEARTLANRKAPSRLVIHRGDGTVQRQHEYGLEP